MRIHHIKAKKIKNSKNQPTIEITVKSDFGKGKASPPSGTSKSKNEVVDFPENIDTSINFVNKTLNERLKNLKITSFQDLEKVENILKKYDNTPNWKKIGGNTVIAIEYAILKAASFNQVWKYINKKAKQIPRPLGKCVGGGSHTTKKAPDFQEFLLISLNSANFEKSVEANLKVYKQLEDELDKYDKTFRGERDFEGGYSPNISNLKILDTLKKVTEKVSKEFKFNIQIGLDLAASQFFKDGFYYYKNFSEQEREKKLTRKEQIDFIINTVKKYNIIYLEDPLEEKDFKGFSILTQKLKNRCLVCGDDLTATNPGLLKKAIKNKSINAIIIKPNQIGSLIKTKEVIDLATKNNITSIISHRSAETKDATISHLAVAFKIPIIKCGIYGKERTSKLEELKKIQKQIKRK